MKIVLKLTVCKLLFFFLLSNLFLLSKVNAQKVGGKVAQERLQAQQKANSLWQVKNESSQKMSKSKILKKTLPSGGVEQQLLAEYGSIEVDRNYTYSAYTPEELVRNIFLKGGGCASVSNITYRGHGWKDGSWIKSENRGLGYFNKGATAVFDMEEGLVLSTGGIQSIEGPNSSAARIEGPSNGVLRDEDLESLITENVANISVLEFDFVPTGNTVQFKYIFASEEYSFYANSDYNDVFGFFISGPGIAGNQNIATLPTTETSTNVLSINNVNDGSRSSSSAMLLHNCPNLSLADAKNSSYYINIPGSFSTCKPTLTKGEERLMLSTQFNGRTKILTATYAVVPCSTYHLKFAVGNVGDQAYQSAVFLEARSFDSGDEMINFGNSIEGIGYLYRGCTSNKLRITRSAPDPFPIQVMLSYAGSTAVQGVDIVGPEAGGAFPTFVEIPAGSSYVDIPYTVPAGPTGYKYLEVSIVCSCDASSLKKKLHIHDRSHDDIFQVSTTPSCSGANSGRINAVIAAGGSGYYETSLDGTIWQSSALGHSNLAPGTYTVYLRDAGSCYQVARTAIITEVTVNTGANQSSCNSTFTMDAAPLNSGESGVWTAVSGAATIAYPNNPKSPVTVTTSPAKFRWTLSTGLCSVYGDVTLTALPKPTIGAILGPSSVCVDSKISLTNSTPGGSWLSSDTVVATVNSSTGELTGVSVGAATIAYTVANAYSCSDSVTKSITVNALPSISPITSPTPISVCTNGTLQLNNATAGGVWKSNNTAIATINSTGVVTGKSVGTTTIAYTLTNSTTGCSQSVTVEITVMDNPTLTISNASVDEGSNLVLTVTRTGDACSPQNYSVKYQTIDGTATIAAPADYVATTGTLTFLPSEFSKTISVKTNSDNIVEGEESLTVRLYDPENCVLSGGVASLGATRTINDMTDGTIMVEKYKPTEPDSTTPASEPSTDGSFRIRFANSNVTCVKDVKVDYVLSGAVPDADYTVDTTVANITSSTATIPKGLSYIEVPIKVVNGYMVEGARTLKIKISNPVLVP